MVVDSIGRTRRPPGRVVLDVRGITKKYGRHTVLSGVDLTVRAGQIVAVVGANGVRQEHLPRYLRRAGEHRQR